MSEARPWCMACGGTVIWPDPRERCLMCGGTAISRGEQPDELGNPDDGPGLIADSRRFLRAVAEFDRLMAEKRAAGGG